MKQLLLRARGVSKKFNYPETVEVIKSIDLDLYAGDSIAILGASGEGKSTLLHILGTLEPPSSGTLEVCGSVITPSIAPAVRNQHIGFIFQAYHLLSDYTVLQNVLIPAQIAKKRTNRGSQAYYRAIQLLSHVGLGHRQNFLTKLLSGGEKQRTAIARALMNHPTILLADEPSGNLDHVTSAEIHQLLIDAAKVQRKGLIIVTHDRELANLCDVRFVLRDGVLHPED